MRISLKIYYRKNTDESVKCEAVCCKSRRQSVLQPYTLFHVSCVLSPSGGTSSPDTEIFHRYSRDFEQVVNVDTLCPALFRARLITSEQMEELVQEVPGNINSRKIKRLLLWLPTSSGQFLDMLIVCLREGEELGHWELADSLEKALWTPLSSQNLYYDGVNNSTLVLCSVREEHEGFYCCRVTSSSGRSVLSDATRVELIKPDGVCACVCPCMCGCEYHYDDPLLYIVLLTAQCRFSLRSVETIFQA